MPSNGHSVKQFLFMTRLKFYGFTLATNSQQINKDQLNEKDSQVKRTTQWNLFPTFCCKDSQETQKHGDCL